MDTPQPFGLVHGRIYQGVGDSNDAGRAPDLAGASGTATFTATVNRFLVNTPGNEMIIIPGPINAPVINGQLQWLNVDDVPLVANLDAAGNNLGWQWNVSFSLTNAQGQPVTLVGWALDVKVYDPNAAIDAQTGRNSTITLLQKQAPVLTGAVTTLAKGDPGPAINVVTGTNTTTTDLTAVGGTVVPTADPLVKAINFVSYAGGGGGGGGGAGTVTKVNGKSPDGTGAVTLAPSDLGAATDADRLTAQQTASNALSQAQAAQTSANTAQNTATAAQNGLSLKANTSALANYAPLASPPLTGTPTTPTPSAGDNGQTIVNSAWVRSLIAALGAATNYGVILLAWDPTTQTWPVTSRPAGAKIIVFFSTNDPAATLPAFKGAGDVWIQQPDSPTS